jgi:membrane protein
MKNLKKYYGIKYWEAQYRLDPYNFFNRWGYIVVTTLHSFLQDGCFEKASTLTFYSILAVIPVVAIGFGVAQHLGFADQFVDQIRSQLESQPQIAEKIIEFSHSALKNTRGGLLATLGLLTLLWTAFRMVENIASYFNQIWKIKSGRSFWRQLRSFIPLILLFPLFLVSASSLIIFFSTEMILSAQSILKYIGPGLFLVLHFLPYILLWVLLSFLYIYLPNKKVSWRAGIISGIAAGVAYQLWQWIYIHFQVGVASYGAIYGSFAAIPLFLLWLNYSWLIVLFGAELAAKIDRMCKS